MAQPAESQAQEELLNYVNTQTHKLNLRNALDYHSVREPDLELISKEGRRLFGHRSVLGIFSPMLVEIFSYTPCCQKASIMFPDTTSEILSHLLNVLYTGSTEATSDKVDVLCGKNGVFATAKLLGIDIKTDQKVIEVIDKRENIVDSHLRIASFRSDSTEPTLHVADVSEDGEDSIVVEGEEEPETMEICPQIPMFDLGSLLYQDHQDPSDYLAEEEPIPAPIPVEGEDYYVCKLPSCQTIIQFENCGARSKILNHYTSHFQRELEQTYGHLITEDLQCTLCQKDLRNFIKSKIWIHIGVTHDKTNDILVNRGIDPISVNIRMKRKASDAFREEVSPRFDESHPGLDYQVTPSHKTNTCKICGQVTQNRKRLLKHYCTKHYIDRLGMMEFDFIEKNKCIHCDKDFIGAKKSSKVIHIGVEHKKIFEILEEDFGKDGYLKHDSVTPAMPPLKKIKTNEMMIKPQTPKIDFSNPHTPNKVEYVTPILSFHNTPRTELSMSDKMKEIQDLGNKCFVCDKKFDLFRSMLLPHYCGHFYKEIAQGHEDYFTLENCKLCGAKATKRKSRIIHLGVKHELVLPYIEEVLKNKDMSAEPGEVTDYEALEENPNEDEDEIEVKQEPETVDEVVDEIVLNNDLDVNEMDEDIKTELNEPKVVTPIRIKTINLKNFKSKEAQNQLEGIIKKEVVGVHEVSSIRKIKTEDDPEDRKTPTQILMKNQNKEVWITPTKSKEEVFVKRSNHHRNIDNQDKTFHLDKLFNESPESLGDELNDECYEEEVTMDNLGLVCKICNVTEATDHELLTHYCNHFTDELKQIAEKMIDEDHKCVECHKMLGNNKRRLYHFGVKHLKVIPMINKKLRSQKNPGTPSKSVVPRFAKKRIEEEASEDLTEEDEFEITYDQPVKIVEEHSAYKDALQTVNKRSELKPKHSNPRVCELCGCKRNTNSNLLLHYTKQHFLEDIKDRFGSLIIDNRCRLCDDVIDVTMKNVGEAEKWIHLGHKHSKTNQILQEMGKTQIIIKDKKDISYLQNAEPVIETKILESVHSSEIFQSSEDEISSSPTHPEPEVFSCQLCDKTTKNQTLLDLHLIAIHFKKEILQKYGNAENTCELCSKTFPNADGFAFHLGQDHDLLRLIMQRRAKKIAEKAESQGHSRLPEVKNSTPKPPEVKIPTPRPPEPPTFPCFKCGAKRRSKKELYGHYSLQHFSKELMEEYGVQKKCSIEECGKILENGTTWISHLGQEHPSVVDKYIPERFWLNEDNTRPAASAAVEEKPKPILKCPLKCSTPFSEQTELLTHFRVVHGFNSEIIKKVIKAHPQLNALNEENYGKGIEA